MKACRAAYLIQKSPRPFGESSGARQTGAACHGAGASPRSFIACRQFQHRRTREVASGFATSGATETQLQSSLAGGNPPQVGIAGDGVVMPALVAAAPPFVP